MRAVIGVMLIAGCNGAALDVPGGTPVSGLYQVTTSLTENSCNIAPQTLLPVQGLIVTPTKINLPQPGAWEGDLMSEMRIDVRGDSVSLDLSPCGAHLTSLIEITRRDSDGIGVRHTWDWIDVTRTAPVCALPQAPCRAVQTFDFELRQRCEAPCSIKGDSFTGFKCVCP